MTSLQSLITATPSPHACSKLMPSRPLLENIILTDLSNHRFRGSEPQQSSATARSGHSSLCSQSSRQRVMMAESISSSKAPFPSATSLSLATVIEKDIWKQKVWKNSWKYKVDCWQLYFDEKFFFPFFSWCEQILITLISLPVQESLSVEVSAPMPWDLPPCSPCCRIELMTER